MGVIRVDYDPIDLQWKKCGVLEPFSKNVSKFKNRFLMNLLKRSVKFSDLFLTSFSLVCLVLTFQHSLTEFLRTAVDWLRSVQVSTNPSTARITTTTIGYLPSSTSSSLDSSIYQLQVRGCSKQQVSLTRNHPSTLALGGIPLFYAVWMDTRYHTLRGTNSDGKRDG